MIIIETHRHVVIVLEIFQETAKKTTSRPLQENGWKTTVFFREQKKKEQNKHHNLSLVVYANGNGFKQNNFDRPNPKCKQFVLLTSVDIYDRNEKEGLFVSTSTLAYLHCFAWFIWRVLCGSNHAFGGRARKAFLLNRETIIRVYHFRGNLSLDS